MTVIDYQSPRTTSRKPITSLALTIGLSVIVGSVLLTSMFVVPRFDQIFRDFKTELPAPTKFVFNVSRWVCIDYGWAWLLSIPTVVPVVVTQLFWRPRTSQEIRRRTILLVLAVVGMVILVSAGTVLVMFLPTIPLIESVNGSGGH